MEERAFFSILSMKMSAAKPDVAKQSKAAKPDVWSNFRLTPFADDGWSRSVENVTKCAFWKLIFKNR